MTQLAGCNTFHDSIVQIMEPILAKPTSLELKEMIAEILVGSTFSTIRRQIERDEAFLLPFTNTDPSRSQFVEVRCLMKPTCFIEITYMQYRK